MSSPLPEYTAPLADMAFLLSEDYPSSSIEEPLFILRQAAKFAETRLAPINREADEIGCRFDKGQVTLPPAMRNAFREYADAGWMGISMPEQWGGQAQSEVLTAGASEMLTSANHAFSMKPALTMSACRALIGHGSEALKSTYLPKMIAGQWTGTMCMTEAHCGSDLGLIRSRAQAHGDHYRIDGSKIFISSGNHDASENIIHLVLARLEGSPQGVKGLSLFLVPEKTQAPNGEWTQDNQVQCIGIEAKMGIHASPTCALQFEQSTGYLVGQTNGGIQAMFTMMNEMRLGTCIQGVGLSERAFQKSLAYAQARTQMRSLTGTKQPQQEADTIIEHPDVRRMLLTQKAFAEGGRALAHFCAQLLDDVNRQERHEESPNDVFSQTHGAHSQQLLDFLTPIAKGFCTETGLESASHAIQVFGGHGFIRENGAEQLYRDGRIGTLYEGTSGIQSLDLLGRKVLGNQGASLAIFTKMMHRLCKAHEQGHALSHLAQQLKPFAKEWSDLSMEIGMKAMQDHDEVGAASFDFLMYSGYLVLGYFHLQNAIAAHKRLSSGATQPEVGLDVAFLEHKVQLAEFYFARILPRTHSLKTTMTASVDSLSPAW